MAWITEKPNRYLIF